MRARATLLRLAMRSVRSVSLTPRSARGATTCLPTSHVAAESPRANSRPSV